ncbi:MAG: diaminopimelate epimerase [Tetrasphaera sp.]|jgi:diaminopimelate epimerase|nr:diaminopimelate epimerase [Tetrasphaera sp.]
MIRFAKGHGTRNDFVLVDDREGRFALTASLAAALADRRSGIGGDGVIRVGRTAAATDPAVAAQAGEAEWFMDYRNADGSLAEMCGNGIRVFAAYLRREGLASADGFAVATRGGVKWVRFVGDDVAVDMGTWAYGDPSAAADGMDALVHVPDHEPFSALRLDLGNPHTVAALPPTVALADLDLTAPPAVNPHPSAGTNVEFVQPVGSGALRMRVHERGVGETPSCGTGVCAAAIATHVWAGGLDGDVPWIVEVPGGRLQVRLLPGQRVELTGPAVLVADGTFDRAQF